MMNFVLKTRDFVLGTRKCLFKKMMNLSAIANHVKDGGCPPLPSRWFWGTCCLDPLWTQRISFLKVTHTHTHTHTT